MEHVYEVIVVGAGAAGIACAQELSRAQKDFLLLEARGRAGGRVLSLHEPDLPVPIELGAEFIHGVPHEILDWLLRLHIPFYDVRDEHLMLNRGKLEAREDFWDDLNRILKKMKKSPRDRTVAEFLASHRSVPEKLRGLFAAFVEGFHAADLNVMGTRALVEATDTEDDELNGSQLFRPLWRYDQILQRILESFAKEDRVRFQARLTQVNWRKGEVKLTTECGPQGQIREFRCRKLVLTLPVGVLKSSVVQWAPFPEAWTRGLRAVHMGHVQKIVFRFRERFWEKLARGPTAFFHADPSYDFPTWWSLQPLRTPHLVAWQGGPRAEALGELGDEARMTTALRTLSRLTRRPVAQLNAEVESWHAHNWSQDPYALGAYTFVGAHGLRAAHSLTHPVENTLYLAGEGTVSGPGRGTVHGAFGSGLRAAKQICGGKYA